MVVRGSGRMKLDDEIVELEAWDAVRVPPGTWRGYEAGPEGLEIFVIGAPNLGEDPRRRRGPARLVVGLATAADDAPPQSRRHVLRAGAHRRLRGRTGAGGSAWAVKPCRVGSTSGASSDRSPPVSEAARECGAKTKPKQACALPTDEASDINFIKRWWPGPATS